MGKVLALWKLGRTIEGNQLLLNTDLFGNKKEKIWEELNQHTHTTTTTRPSLVVSRRPTLKTV